LGVYNKLVKTLGAGSGEAARRIYSGRKVSNGRLTPAVRTRPAWPPRDAAG
jgi:hypothetical protein